MTTPYTHKASTGSDETMTAETVDDYSTTSGFGMQQTPRGYGEYIPYSEIEGKVKDAKSLSETSSEGSPESGTQTQEHCQPLKRRKTGGRFSSIAHFRSLRAGNRLLLRVEGDSPATQDLSSPQTDDSPPSSEESGKSIVLHVEDLAVRYKFILVLARALLTFGAPSHRIEAQLVAASETLDVHTAFVYLPNLIIVSFGDVNKKSTEVHFVKASGRISLTALHKVHLVYRDVVHDRMGAKAGRDALTRLLKAPPIYGRGFRCGLAFITAAIICPLAFGGSALDMLISGLFGAIVQFIGLKGGGVACNVYEISASIIVSFIARALGTLQARLFCYTAISSASVVSILPGFTILTASLELASRNILCGSLRMVYAIMYTLFLGFGLTIGSDLYLVVNPEARSIMANRTSASTITETVQATFFAANSTTNLFPYGGSFTISNDTTSAHSVHGCYRNSSRPWYLQPFPWWTAFFLVPLYTFCSSLANLQRLKSKHLPVMVLFACASYAANKAADTYIFQDSSVVSAVGATVIGLLGNGYARMAHGTAFTSMVTGVLFLVPSGLAQSGGFTQQSSDDQYSSGLTLGVSMVEVGIGVTLGLFFSQMIIYSIGFKRHGSLFSF